MKSRAMVSLANAIHQRIEKEHESFKTALRRPSQLIMTLYSSWIEERRDGVLGLRRIMFLIFPLADVLAHIPPLPGHYSACQMYLTYNIP